MNTITVFLKIYKQFIYNFQIYFHITVICSQSTLNTKYMYKWSQEPVNRVR